jgi:HSP20 family molecular chaperone IbpA
MCRKEDGTWVDDVLDLYNELLNQTIINNQSPRCSPRTVAKKLQIPVNIVDYTGASECRFSLPGVDPQNVDVFISDDSKYVVVRLDENDSDETGVVKHFEFVDSPEYRERKVAITNPDTYDLNLVSSSMKNGLLKVLLPKKNAAKPERKTIKIKIDE